MTVDVRRWSAKQHIAQPARGPAAEQRRLGPAGYLFLLLWTLALVLLVPAERTFLAAGIALLAGFACHGLAATPARRWRPVGGRRLHRYPWLLFAGLMLFPALVAAVEIGPGWQPRIASWAPMADGARMLVRALVIMVAVNRFAATVSIGEIAAFFERAGVHGLGFALGVAVNLFPILRQTLSSTWGSMRMRGGFRRHHLRHLRLFMTTLVYTTLRRAETIALAAETRAYSPEKSHPVPLPRGSLDAWLLVAGSGLFLLLLFL